MLVAVMMMIVRVGMDGGGVNGGGLLLLLLGVTRRGGGDGVPVEPEVLLRVGDEGAEEIGRGVLEGARRDGAEGVGAELCNRVLLLFRGNRENRAKIETGKNKRSNISIGAGMFTRPTYELPWIVGEEREREI